VSSNPLLTPSISSRQVDVNVLGDEGFRETIWLPTELQQYRELWTLIEETKQRSFDEWRALMRLWSAGDLFFLLLFVLSPGTQAWDIYRNEPHFWHPLQLRYAREIQFNSHMWVDICAREFGKSTWKTFGRNLWTKLSNPNLASCIFSNTREKAQKHLGRIGDECRANELLKTVWRDRFYWDPNDAKTTWSLDKGFCIKRPSARPEQTFEAHAFITKLPTGMHYNELYHDDIEEEEAVRSEESMANIETKFTSSLDLTVQGFYVSPTGTYYHPNAMMRKLHMELGYTLRKIPGEDLEDKPEDKTEAGPLGGRPIFFTRESLFARINAKGGPKNPKARRNHSLQMCCNPLAGDSHAKLKKGYIRYYEEPPLEIGRDCHIVACIDTSPGANDPTFCWIWGLTRDRKFLWLDGFRKRLPPSRRQMEIYIICKMWEGIGELVEIRMENHGQSEVDLTQETFNNARGLHTPIVGCHDNRPTSDPMGFTGKNGGKREREFERWEPHLRGGKVWFPRHGIMTEDHEGDPFNLMEYFLDFELDNFPKPTHDDGLDAGSLIWEPSDIAGPLPWPARAKRPWEEDHRQSRETGSYISQPGL
jgi:hypothetical protein